MNESKEKIKVLRIIARLNRGGPAMHTLLLTAGLNNDRFSSSLATGIVAEGEEDITYMAKEAGIEPFIIPELTREIRFKDDLIAFLKLFRLMRRIKPDIVHTHTAKAGALGRIAAIINRVPVKIHTFHGHVFHSYFGRFKTNLFIMIERMLAAFTDRIIVISQNQLIDVRDRYRIASKDKYSVIPVGLNLEPFLNSKRNGNLKKQFSVDEDTLLVGIVGRLVDVKNHKMFLDVAKDIKIEAHDVKARFLIIGDGPLRTELESYAQMLKIRDSVIFMGWQKEMAAIYKDLDIVCLTSLNEGTPISLIEAMASGKAVLSTDVGGVRDVVTHNITGLLSPSGDVGKFSSNLLVLLRDKARREEIAGRARESVLKNFSRERLIRDVERLYAEELRKRSA